MSKELIKEIRDHSQHQWSNHDYVQSEKVRGMMRRAADRIEWLEGLFDFSDTEVVLHTAPGDPVTKDAVVVLRSHYEAKR